MDLSPKNRVASIPRGLIFVGGDIHSGGIFDIFVSKPEFTAPCLVASGISHQMNTTSDPLIGTLVDEDFEVATGIQSTMRDFVTGYNFGVIQIVPTGGTPLIVPAVAHKGNSFAWGLQVSVPVL